MAAATEKNPALIALVRGRSKVSIPWSDEFEKMVSGMNYRACPEMQAHRIAVMKLLHSFNNENLTDFCTMQTLGLNRMKVARDLLGSVGEGMKIEAPFYSAFGCNTFIGDGVYINRDVQIHDKAPVTIGNRVLIGPSVMISTATHPLSAFIRQAQGGCHAFPVDIGDDTWICARVTINPGVTIGQGCVVAAGSVVTKDVEAGMLVGGVPAKVLRKLEDCEAEKAASQST